MYSVHCCCTTNSQAGSSRSGISELNDQPLARAVAVHDDDLGRAGRLRAAYGGVDLLGVETPALLVHRVAAASSAPT